MHPFDENVKLLDKNKFPVTFGITLTSNIEQDEKYIRRLCKIAKEHSGITINYRIALATPCPGREFRLMNFDNSIKLLYEISKKETPLVPIDFDCAINGCGVSFECFEKTVQDYRTEDFSYNCEADYTIDVLVDKAINFCYSLPEEIIPIKKIDRVPVLPTSIDGVLCVCPTDFYEGFFVARIKKK